MMQTCNIIRLCDFSSGLRFHGNVIDFCVCSVGMKVIVCDFSSGLRFHGNVIDFCVCSVGMKVIVMTSCNNVQFGSFFGHISKYSMV